MKLNQEIYEKIKKYPYLCKLCLERKIEGNDCSNYILKLEFCDFPNYGMDDKVILVFSDVQNLQMKNLDGLLCAHIFVRDMRDRGLENINYYVRDDEEDMFSFYCSSIDMVTNTEM